VWGKNYPLYISIVWPPSAARIEIHYVWGPSMNMEQDSHTIIAIICYVAPSSRKIGLKLNGIESDWIELTVTAAHASIVVISMEIITNTKWMANRRINNGNKNKWQKRHKTKKKKRWHRRVPKI